MPQALLGAGHAVPGGGGGGRGSGAESRGSGSRTSLSPNSSCGSHRSCPGSQSCRCRPSCACCRSWFRRWRRSALTSVSRSWPGRGAGRAGGLRGGAGSGSGRVGCGAHSVRAGDPTSFSRGLTDESEILRFLQHGTLVGLLPVPHPILIRKYQANSGTAMWFRTYMWGVIYLRWVLLGVGKLQPGGDLDVCLRTAHLSSGFLKP